MLSKVQEPLFNFYISWMLKSAGIQPGTETEALIVDMVRFIVVNVTPTNEIIQSKIMQRFSLIGHLF